MKRIFFSCLILYTSGLLAQKSDSTIFYKYHNSEGVQKVIYLEEQFKNGNLKYEGWAVYKDLPGYEFEEFKFGKWIFYYKNGNIKYTYNYRTQLNDTVTLKEYDRRNRLRYEAVYFVKEDIPTPTSNRLTKKDAKTKHNKWEKFTCYNKNGITLKGQFTSDAKKEGKWFYYKKGTLRKVKTYKNGKLILIEREKTKN